MVMADASPCVGSVNQSHPIARRWRAGGGRWGHCKAIQGMREYLCRRGGCHSLLLCAWFGHTFFPVRKPLLLVCCCIYLNVSRADRAVLFQRDIG